METPGTLKVFHKYSFITLPSQSAIHCALNKTERTGPPTEADSGFIALASAQEGGSYIHSKSTN
jgi:hypothetical protein